MTQPSELAIRLPTGLTWALVGLHALVYLVQLLHAGSALAPDTEDLMALGGNVGHLSLTTEPWRLLTGIFMHGSWLHLLMNMGLLMMVGPRTEAAFGRSGLLVIYMAGGLLASLASASAGVGAAVKTNMLGMTSVQFIVSVGASGAIMGLCAALLVAALLDQEEAIDALHDGALLKSILPTVGLTLAQGFVVTSTDNAAHIAGLFAGAGLGPLVGLARYVGFSPVRMARLGGALVLALALAWSQVPSPRAAEVRELAQAHDEAERPGPVVDEAAVQRAIQDGVREQMLKNGVPATALLTEDNPPPAAGRSPDTDDMFQQQLKALDGPPPVRP